MTDLTDRQREVAQLVADGLTTKRIAASLGITERRVRAILTSVAYLIGADASKDERIQVADWWRTHRYTDAA